MHCLHPEFLRAQLDATLERLGTTYLDAYLLHNPEHYLMSVLPPTAEPWGGEEGGGRHRAELRGRLARAFEALEAERAAGRIRAYGVSSNAFALPEGHPHHLPAALLEECGGGDGLRVLEMPANVLEPGALRPAGPAAWATARGLDVVANRVLSGFLSGFDEHGSWRFADAPFPAGYAAARDALLGHVALPAADPAELAALPDAERAEAEETHCPLPPHQEPGGQRGDQEIWVLKVLLWPRDKPGDS